METQTKTCCHCKNLKDINSFYNDKHKADGKKPRCKICDKLSLNQGRRKEYEKEYRQTNPDKRRIILANYYVNNKAKHKKVQDEYRKTDKFKHLHRRHGAIRRARFLNAFIEDADYHKLFLSHPYCTYCNIHLLFNDVEFDHFIPISRGGKHETSNIRVSCMVCNRRKGAHHQMV